ncbi:MULTISPECIES: sigma factor G inhibitor Gin [Jeotgalibacillus]|uniref:sigma factor G inhibitor Gin n=1 Tax=Jeotgalibacillus TaxID=157226 RepID=UPI00141BADF2|nr:MULTISPECIES: sigma factor G inhibitor Gin [Jeotgalibacillus]
MRVCRACGRKYKRGIRLSSKFVCVWCEQSLIQLKADDQDYDRWMYLLKPESGSYK